MGKVNGVLLLVNLTVILFSFFVEAGQTDDVVQESSGGLPFLQFTNGGVRVNFGGYHAEAGLGGLLGGSRTGGGLHASAGTPFGAHAGAGLGGLLNGDSASTGGGLHAEAGLGNGGPEARAGLGGALNANSNSPIAGGLYAHATPGDAIAENPVATNVQIKPEEKATSGHTNIQIISRGGGIKHKNERAIASKSFVVVNEAVPPEPKVVPAPVVPVVPVAPVASAELFGGLYAGAAIGNNYEKSAVGQAQSVPVSGTKAISVSSGPNVTAETNVPGNTNVNVAQEQPIYNRWYLRKRFRNGPIRKQVIHTKSYIPSPPNTVSASAGTSGVIQGNIDDSAAAEYAVVGTKVYKGGSLFDDIFNIPISTLTAVNQLLKNNVG